MAAPNLLGAKLLGQEISIEDGEDFVFSGMQGAFSDDENFIMGGESGIMQSDGKAVWAGTNLQFILSGQGGGQAADEVTSNSSVTYAFADKATMWQDTAGTIPVTENGDIVARVDDQSGNGNHAIQSTASNRPVYRENSSGSWLEMGADDYFVVPDSDDFNLSASCTVIASGAAMGTSGRVLSKAASGATETTADSYFFSTNSGLGMAGGFMQTVDLPPSQEFNWTCIWDGTAIEYYLFGELYNAGTAGGGALNAGRINPTLDPVDSDHDIYIGRRNAPSDLNMAGRLTHLIITQEEVSASDIALVSGYLAGFEPDVKENSHPGLIGSFTFDNISGASIIDESDAGNNITNVGCSFSPGLEGDAIVCSSSAEYIDAIAFDGLLTDAFSVSLWVTADSTAAQTYIMGASNTVGTNSGFEVSILAGGQIRIAGRTSTGGSFTVFLLSNGLMSAGVRRHLCITHDNADIFKLYIDGEMDATTIVAYNPIAGDETAFFRRKTTTSDNHLEGSIDNVRIFQETITANAVKDIFDNNK